MVGDPSSEPLTFLFADLEASTRLWERLPEAMPGAMERHDAILRNAVEAAGGRVVKSTGDGLMAVFPSAADGAAASLRASSRSRTSRGARPGRCACAWGSTRGRRSSAAGTSSGRR